MSDANKLRDTKNAVHSKLIGVPYGSFAHSYLVLEYLIGETPPNYPVPAIDLVVDIRPYEVNIYRSISGYRWRGKYWDDYELAQTY